MAETSKEDRARLAPLIRERRESLFGTKRAAYQEAGVNPSTWDRVEEGEAVRDDIMRRVIRTLWPGTDGDWRRIPTEGETAGDHDNERDDDGVTPALRALIRATVEEVLAADRSGDFEKRA